MFALHGMGKSGGKKGGKQNGQFGNGSYSSWGWHNSSNQGGNQGGSNYLDALFHANEKRAKAEREIMKSHEKKKEKSVIKKVCKKVMAGPFRLMSSAFGGSGRVLKPGISDASMSSSSSTNSSSSGDGKKKAKKLLRKVSRLAKSLRGTSVPADSISASPSTASGSVTLTQEQFQRLISGSQTAGQGLAALGTSVTIPSTTSATATIGFPDLSVPGAPASSAAIIDRSNNDPTTALVHSDGVYLHIAKYFGVQQADIPSSHVGFCELIAQKGSKEALNQMLERVNEATNKHQSKKDKCDQLCAAVARSQQIIT